MTDTPEGWTDDQWKALDEVEQEDYGLLAAVPEQECTVLGKAHLGILRKLAQARVELGPLKKRLAEAMAGRDCVLAVVTQDLNRAIDKLARWEHVAKSPEALGAFIKAAMLVRTGTHLITRELDERFARFDTAHADLSPVKEEQDENDAERD